MEAGMNKAHFIGPLAVLLMITVTGPPAAAKGPTVKITISGGELTSPIEITDPRILDNSNVWAGEFLDRAAPSPKEPPRGLGRYEVSFYVKFGEDDDAEKVYVLYYSPSPSTQPGLIYLPGKGELWYSRNVRTILRGSEGKWHYVSPAWEHLIRPVLARAEAAITSR